ncbi:MAG: hypothetical protein FWE01_00355 [Firmicutes bacterium]|nr:hypothetical protein [Bacillota bacterium]
MKTSLIRFLTSDNLRLDGLLFEPNIKTSKIVIHVHGTSGDFFSNKFIDVFAEKLTAKGIAFLTFNNRGACNNYEFRKEINGRRVDKVEIGSENEIFEESNLDLISAVDFVKSKGFTDISLQGHSYGCNKVVWYAQGNNFNDKLILLAPCDLVELTEQDKLDPKKAQDIENCDMFKYRNGQHNPVLSKIKGGILVQIGTDDPYILQPNKQDCLDYLKVTFKNSDVAGNLIVGANHGYEEKFDELVDNVVAWLV